MVNLTAALDVATATHSGMVRSHNEDSIAADAEIGLAVLADGMGGYNAGEVASGIAVAMISAEMKKMLGGENGKIPDAGAESLLSEHAMYKPILQFTRRRRASRSTPAWARLWW